MGGIHMSGVPMSGFVYDPVNGVFRPIWEDEYKLFILQFVTDKN
jgi:hypothetical protein